MIGASTLAKTVIVAGAVALAVGLGPHGGAAPQARPAPAAGTRAHLGLDAASDAEARHMRRVTLALGAELSAAARCASAECMVPALRRAGMAGRTNGMLVRVVIASVPTGRCRNYLFGLSANNDAASDDALGWSRGSTNPDANLPGTRSRRSSGSPVTCCATPRRARHGRGRVLARWGPGRPAEPSGHLDPLARPV